jgi:hypothetical protein
MVAKSSAARGRVTFPLHRLVSSLVAGGSFGISSARAILIWLMPPDNVKVRGSRPIAPVQVVSTVPVHIASLFPGGRKMLISSPAVAAGYVGHWR